MQEAVIKSEGKNLIKNEDNTKYLRIGRGGVLVNNTIWCSELKQNGLYKIDLNLKRVEYISEFPFDKLSYTPYKDPILDNQRLYFIPIGQDDLLIYNMLNGEMEKVNIKNRKDERYGVGVMTDENVFLFPSRWNERIAIVKKNSKKVIYQYDLLKDIEKFLGEKIDSLFWNSYVYKGNIYLPMRERSVLVEYNCITRKYVFYWIDQTEDQGIINCEGRGHQLYLLDNMGGVYVFDVNKKDAKKVFTMKDGTLCPYVSLHLFKNDEIWLIPYTKNEIVIYSIKTKVKMIQNIVVEGYRICDNEYSISVRNRYKFSKVFRQDDILWLYPNATNLLIRVDMNTREQQGFPVLLPQDRVALLDNFLNNVNKKNNKQIDNCGKGIWKNIRG